MRQKVIMMVEKMRPYDRVSIVAYDDLVDLVIPSVNCLDKRNIINSINNISVGLSTNLHGGWLMGAEQVALHKSAESINRVLLYQMVTLMLVYVMLMNLKYNVRLAETNVTTSTYGLGYQFNEELHGKHGRIWIRHSYCTNI